MEVEACLVVEMTDGTSQANADFRRNVGFYCDLVKANVERIVIGLSAELEEPGHGRRRHTGVAALREDARQLRRDRAQLARRRREAPRLRNLRLADLRRE